MEQLFNIDLNSKPILLNQAGSGWNPIESTKFFSNRNYLFGEKKIGCPPGVFFVLFISRTHQADFVIDF